MARRASKQRPPLDDDEKAREFAELQADIDAERQARVAAAERDAARARERADAAAV